MLPFIFTPAYAEIHYRFPYFFSLLKKAEPEIIADAPYRLTLPGPLPVLLLIKDAHLHPITLQQAEVFINGRKRYSQSFNRRVESRFYETFLEIPINDDTAGPKEVAVKIRYRVRGKQKVCFNDNYRTSSKAPLSVYFSAHDLPRAEHFYYGDLHSHSSFTEDQIEFGAGLVTMRRMAQAVGLHFFAVTDHSYDLDDLPDNYLTNDPQLRKWQAFWQEVQRLNGEASLPLMVPGEELSVGNHRGRNAHLLILNNARFIVGRGDGGERWFRFKPDHSLTEIPAMLTENAMMIPAHSAEKVPLLQKMLLNRGEWGPHDLQLPDFKALQSINGGTEQEIRRGIEQWVKHLLTGRRLTLVAGNDAHGNFARSRQIGMPFFSIRENEEHRFGVWRTAVFLQEAPRTPDDIVNALKRGNVSVTNGPFVNMTVEQESGHTVPMGGLVQKADFVNLHILSTPEFGPIDQVRVLAGDLQTGREHTVWQKSFEAEHVWQLHEKITLRLSGQIGYIRCQAITRLASHRFWGFGNAVYVQNQTV